MMPIYIPWLSEFFFRFTYLRGGKNQSKSSPAFLTLTLLAVILRQLSGGATMSTTLAPAPASTHTTASTTHNMLMTAAVPDGGYMWALP